MISLKKKYGTYVEGIATESAEISTLSTNTPDVDGCSLVIDNTCFIATQVPGEITSGDYAYTDSEGTIPFDGGGLYWKAKITSDPTNIVCQISSLGLINNYNICV